MSSLSYQEKSLYAELLADLAVFLPYFVLIHKPAQLSVNVIAAAIALLIVANIVFQGVIAAVTRNRLKDERDRLIRLRGYRAGYIALASLMVLGIGALWLSAPPRLMTSSFMALHLLSVFCAMLMLGEVVKTLAQLLAYRRTV